MGEYRLYLVEDQDATQACHEFGAENDGEAAMIAALLFDACSDVRSGYDLWNGSRKIVSVRDGVGLGHKVPAFDEIAEKMQRHVLQLEEAIQSSQWHLSTSKKLLEAIERVRNSRGSVVKRGG